MIENYAEKIKHESNGFIRHNGIRIVSVDEERSVLEAEITDNSRTLTAVGREIKVGGHVGFFEVNITDDTGALVACAQMNMYFLD